MLNGLELFQGVSHVLDPRQRRSVTKFWRNTRTEKHVDDPLATDPPRNDPPSPPVQRDIVCSACGCKLARNGEIVATGENYKKFLKHDREMELKNEEIARLQSELTAVKQERDALRGSGSASASGHRPGSRVA
jgi:hypothetical protein